MKVLIAGASGATGSQLVEQLLIGKHNVKIIVRTPENLPEQWKKILGFMSSQPIYWI
jgi:uncharacterized protein YbjT (DUF2867 family)